MSRNTPIAPHLLPEGLSLRLTSLAGHAADLPNAPQRRKGSGPYPIADAPTRSRAFRVLTLQ